MTDHTPEDSRDMLETWLCRSQHWLLLALVIGGVVLLPTQLAPKAVQSAGALYPSDHRGAWQPAVDLQSRAESDVEGIFRRSNWGYTGGNPILQGASDYD